MTPIPKKWHNWKQYCLRTLVGAALLSSSILPAIAAGTPAGVTINNTAFGSFENPTAPPATPPTAVESNTVTITVAEVAGISVTPAGAVEAPAGVSGEGPGQGDGAINEQDVVYFTYRITNTGNDATQFFIPGVPSDVVNGTFDETLYGPIEVVGYSADGVNVTPESVSIPVAGANTDTLGLTGDGSVPVDGFIEVRVPIKADAGLVAGTDEIIPTLGNTPDELTQNSPETPGGEFGGTTNDVATRDNTGTDNGDASAANPSTEREASARNPVLVGALALDYGDAPDVSAGSTPAPDAVTPADYETAPGRGPSHISDSTNFLGTAVDVEAVAFDDGLTEDDGVELGGSVLHNQSVITGQSYSLDVTTAGPDAGVLNAWIDYNRDGDFVDAGEQIALNEAPTGGSITLPVTVPTGATAGVTYARFRYSTNADLTPTDAASDGEVEDYLITLVDDAPSLRLVKRVTSVGGTPITNVVDDPGDANDDAGVNWPADYLEGDVAADVEPLDVVEYTIYFLSDGNTDVDNVRICDFIPANTTYVDDSLEISQGTAAASTLTDASGDDDGENFVATPASSPCDPAPGANTTGGVLVDVPGSLSPATGPGTPTTSYGYIRFSVTVD